MLKTLSKTRWSARADASKALYKSYNEIISALEDISTDNNQTKDVQYEARNLTEKLKSLEITIMICLWHRLLEKFLDVSEKLQGQSVDMDSVIGLYSYLQSFVSTLRDEREFERLESEAKEMCKSNVYKKDVTRKKI